MELSAYYRFVAALLFVLGIIGIFALVARRIIPGARNINRRGAKRRLSVVEVVPVDTKRRLVLLRRDDTEHLVMLSPQGDTVIERNIGTHFVDLIDTGKSDDTNTLSGNDETGSDTAEPENNDRTNPA
ncbi:MULTISPECIES: FliO/MopB family protein [Thalassospira]|uniref:Flagellar biosynthetic protein FliO n=1 Tax=Thalassospira aquimaris TaxID=3037796 RepID=A0ABT6G890_9PROT|nr:MULTISPECIES: flagellar biosynthetic protein FliO [Thalassospira]MDG4718282.1 flagellar biosynthetic protein FliO [Thalassospira sp. FZY0004]